MEEKKRINAAISYLFMGELFLLAKNNPNFGDIFVRNHAKSATKIHLTFLVIILAYKKFAESFLYISVPIININISRVIEASLYIIFTLLLIRWAYKAYYWKSADEIKIRKDYLKIEEELVDNNLSETSKIIYIASYIPFFGIIVWSKYNSNINKYGMKIWWIFSLILVFFLLTKHNDLAFILSLFYIILMAFAGVMIFTQQKIMFSNFVNNIYNLKELYCHIRAIFYYILEAIRITLWWKGEISFWEIYNKVKVKEEKYYSLANEYLVDKNLIFWNKLIFIPIVNLIYLPTFFFDKNSRYIIAIIQWLVITVFSIFLWYFDYSDYSILLLFPIFLWIANTVDNPFYRIPIIFEVYELIDKLTFGIFSKIKFLKEKKKEVQEISIKI